MTVVIAGLETKSEKIRALLHEGYMRTEVADFLNIRYQHVRKVAVDAGIEGGLQRGLVVVPKSKPIPKVRADVAIDVLADAGFERLGMWVADGAGGIGLDTSAPRDAGVYVFVVDGLIKYIGVSRAGIRSRMSNYRLGQAGQKTSARVNQIINEHVTAGTVVEIYIAMPLRSSGTACR
ncbi:hypothetical protein [Mesorhizobium waimense]|uniref:hypothetical protein n=1 Tax=Mesorhizobium waimense TaxID=1300307 RepID=UPI00142D8CCE|nr:hypothetical protein [Mesorhizobium waimense]